MPDVTLMSHPRLLIAPCAFDWIDAAIIFGSTGWLFASTGEWWWLVLFLVLGWNWTLHFGEGPSE